MAKELKTQIRIEAAPDQVWDVLTDFEKYPAWNPFIKSLTGQVAVGHTINVRLEPPEGSGMTFKPKVLAMEKNKEFRWLGQLFFKGLFDGEHRFALVDNGDGSTTFLHSERFEGILVPLFNEMIEVNTRNGFEDMNQQLKIRVEGLYK
ncbi:SRPBCC domain-containing protein [Persicitalea jodogahamensis]|uniref:SRPBCC domain-containing protein n=1 Tax=Persicitalea jodogahamensis TaxID=402147 RepID=A0A8J3DAW0_9BACT|nr:SRPBCC domain-containing protein [Persicitalea jodogahamensis]GHB77638.1 hypothetical protein GCM10007390_34760 [Persicitalea jodogahamensis]